MPSTHLRHLLLWLPRSYPRPGYPPYRAPSSPYLSSTHCPLERYLSLSSSHPQIPGLNNPCISPPPPVRSFCHLFAVLQPLDVFSPFFHTETPKSFPVTAITARSRLPSPRLLHHSCCASKATTLCRPTPWLLSTGITAVNDTGR